MVELNTGAELLRDLEKIIGRDAVDRFTDSVGGGRVYIPRRAHGFGPSQLVEALGGMESAAPIIEKLAPLYGGMNVDIPLHRSSLAARRRRTIEEALIRGEESNGQIARRLGVHERTIYIHRRRLKDAGLLEPAAQQQAPAISLGAGERIELDLLAHSQPDQRSNDEIARLHGGDLRDVTRIRSRLIRQGHIPKT